MSKELSIPGGFFGAALLFSVGGMLVPNEVAARDFHGYPCTDDCSGHKVGWDWAERRGVNDESACTGRSRSFIEGCRAYVERLEAQPANATSPGMIQGAVYVYVDDEGVTRYTNVVPRDRDFRVLFTYIEKSGVLWTEIGSDTEGTRFYFRLVENRGEDSETRAWLMASKPRISRDPLVGVSSHSSIDLVAIDCHEKSTKQLQTSLYSEAFGAGNVLGTFANRGGESAWAVPGTIAEMFVDRACVRH